MKPSAHHSMLAWGIAASCLALVAGREFYKRAIVPLHEREPELLQDAADLAGRIEGAKKEISGIHAQGKGNGVTAGDADRREGHHSAGLNPLSLPAVVGTHFSRFGLEAPAVRRLATEAAQDVSGYERSSWLVTVPLDKSPQGVASVLRASSGLDPRGSDLMVRDFTIWPDPEDSTRRRATIHVSFLSKKKEASR